MPRADSPYTDLVKRIEAQMKEFDSLTSAIEDGFDDTDTRNACLGRLAQGRNALNLAKLFVPGMQLSPSHSGEEPDA
jgi:hypothetical protein